MDISRSEMKELLTVCTKNVYFTFNGDIWLQTDGVAIASPFDSILTRIFIVHLERSLFPVLKGYLSFWKRYVNHTTTFTKTGSAGCILSISNSFHPSIEFTYETEVNSKWAFLDVLLLRESQNIITTVYRNVTKPDIYLNWNSFCPQSWTERTFKILGSKSTLNLLRRRFIKTWVTSYTEGFSWEKLFSILSYKTNICRRGTRYKKVNKKTSKARTIMSQIRKVEINVTC